MPSSRHLGGYVTPMVIMSLATAGGVAFAAGAVVILNVVQGANQLSFGQLLALGAVLGGIPTTVTLWVIKVLYDLRAHVAKLEDIPQRMTKLEKRLDGHLTTGHAIREERS